jgi:hypothetical protein
MTLENFKLLQHLNYYNKQDNGNYKLNFVVFIDSLAAIEFNIENLD